MEKGKGRFLASQGDLLATGILEPPARDGGGTEGEAHDMSAEGEGGGGKTGWRGGRGRDMMMAEKKKMPAMSLTLSGSELPESAEHTSGEASSTYCAVRRLMVRSDLRLTIHADT